MKRLQYLLFVLCAITATAQEIKTQEPRTDDNKFRQMYDLLATPNMYRTASGAPGPAYYQQKADYKMDIEIDDKNARLYGVETITYHNNAQESLEYLWLQLDQNMRAANSKTPLVQNTRADVAISAAGFSRKYLEQSFDGGFKIDYVRDAAGKPMDYTINETMMR